MALDHPFIVADQDNGPGAVTCGSRDATGTPR